MIGNQTPQELATAQQREREAIVSAINVLSAALPDDDDMEKLSRVLVELGLLSRCAGCGWVYQQPA